MPDEILVNSDAGHEIAPFNPRTASPLVNKSISAETRRLYHRVIHEFFSFVGYKHETLVSAGDMLRWRDDLIAKGSKASTISLKLSMLRPFSST